MKCSFYDLASNEWFYRVESSDVIYANQQISYEMSGIKDMLECWHE